MKENDNFTEMLRQIRSYQIVFDRSQLRDILVACYKRQAEMQCGGSNDAVGISGIIVRGMFSASLATSRLNSTKDALLFDCPKHCGAKLKRRLEFAFFDEIN